MSPLAYTFACMGLLVFGAPLLLVMIVLDQWIKKRTPPDPHPKETERDDAHLPRQNFEVLRHDGHEPLTAEPVQDDQESAPPDSPEHNPLGRNNHDPR